MKSIIKTSLNFRYIVVILAATVIVFGITQLRDMPVDVLPEFSPPYVEIQTEALGLAAEEVEQMITVPMEQDLLAGVSWLDVIRSESVPGLSSVLIYFEPGTDIFKARQMVAERLAQAAVGLPHVSKPPTMIQPLSSTSRFMIVGLSSEELSLMQMSVLARWTIAPRLMGVPGVAHVAIWGNRDRQLQVQVDPEQLQSAGVTLNQVIETTGNALWVSSLTFLEASTPGTGGFIDTPQQRLGIWHVLPISSPSELAQVPLDRTAYRLGDVAKVVEDHQPLIGDAIVNESPNLLLVIEKLPGTHTLEVTQGIEDALDAMRPGFAEINFDATLFRPASFIEIVFANYGRTLLISTILVVLALVLFQWSWRAAVINFVAISLSLVATVCVLYLRGQTLNMMVMAGLAVALGIVINEAVIDINRVIQRLRLNKDGNNPQPIQHLILETTSEMRNSVFFVTFVTLIVVLPVFFISGMVGDLIQPLFVTYALAVIAAMVVALTVTPVLSLILFSNMPLRESESPLIRWLRQGYEKVLLQIVQKPWPVYAAAAVLVIAGIVLLPFIKTSQLLPSFNEPYLTVQLQAAPGTSLPAMQEIVSQVSNELKSTNGVTKVAAHIGRAVFGDRVVNVNSAELWVSIDPNVPNIASAIRQRLTSYSAYNPKVQTHLDQTLEQLESETSNLVAVRIYGENHVILHEQAEKMQQVLAGISGIVNSRVMLPIEEPTLEIEVDLASAQKFGVKPGDVRRAAATLLSGIQVGSLFEQQKVFDVVVWGIPEIRDSVEDAGELLLDTPGGGHVKLKEVADLRIVSSPTVIKREGVSPYIDIAFGIQGRNSGAVIKDIQSAFLSFDFPLEYHAEVINELADRQAAQIRIITAGLVALIGIFLLLQASFRSWHLASVVLLTLPVSLAGGVAAVFLGGSNPLLLGLLCGLLLVLGINLRGAALMVKHYQYLEEQEGESFGMPMILRGAQERFSPILITALTTILAFLPFLLFGNIPGFEVVRPIVFVAIGGLVASTLVNLFILPSLYLRFGLNREPELGLVPASATD